MVEIKLVDKNDKKHVFDIEGWDLIKLSFMGSFYITMILLGIGAALGILYWLSNLF